MRHYAPYYFLGVQLNNLVLQNGHAVQFKKKHKGKKMKHFSPAILLITIGFFVFSLVSAQDDTCPAIIYEAVTQTSELCDSTARNEACYGHQNIDVTLRDSGTSFATPGDIAELGSIERIQTMPLDTALSQFGIVLLRAQADLPNTIPGQNVTLLLMGDITVEDQSAETGGNPMQAFIFTPGIGTSMCQEADYNSIAIQSPENTVVHLTVNGAEIELGSTAILVGKEGNLMDMLIIEGEGVIRTEAGEQTVTAGNWSQVLVEDGVAIGAPEEPVPFPPERIAHLPLDLLNAGRNLALGKPVNASNTLATDAPENVVDGNTSGDINWNAGDNEPPQWIEIDLEREYAVETIRLLTSQFPEEQFDPTVHEIYVAGEDQNLRLVHTFSEETQDDQWLEFTPEFPLMGVRYVRVQTTSTVHFVSWGEIEVIGSGFAGCVISADNTVNVREGAGTDYPLVSTMSAGEQRLATGQAEDAQGFTWWQMQGGNIWVREDVVRAEGYCELIPVIAAD